MRILHLQGRQWYDHGGRSHSASEVDGAREGDCEVCSISQDGAGEGLVVRFRIR